MVDMKKEHLAETIGQRLKELRKASTDLGQGDIAAEIGVTKQAVNSYENGRRIPDLPILIALSERYGCSMDYLLGLSDKMSQNSHSPSAEPEAKALFDSLSKLADDEGNFLLTSFTEIADSLAIHKFNPQRRKFIECLGDLLGQLAAHFDLSGKLAKDLSEKSNAESLTPEDVALALAHFSSSDDMEKAVDDIKKAGIEAALSFSVKARQVLGSKTKRKEYLAAVDDMLNAAGTNENA